MHNTPELDSIEELTDLSGESLLSFISKPCNDEHLDYEMPNRITDRDAIGIICDKCNCSHVQEIGGWDDERRNFAIITACENGISIRQLSRITGITKAVIEKALKRRQENRPLVFLSLMI